MLSERLVRDLYAAFNARDIESALAAMDPDVDWPNAWEGGRLHGHSAVREYWTRQFAAIDGRVEPVSVTQCADGRTAVAVHQTVRSLDGELIAEEDVTHTYTVRSGRIVRMDVS